MIFRCSKRRAGCNAYLHLIDPIDDIDECLQLDDDEDCAVEKEHNHPEEPYGGDWSDLLQIMKKRSRETNDGLREIFDDVCRPFPEITANYNFDSCSSILSRERQKHRQNIPSTLHELGTILCKEKIAAAHVSSDGQSAIIFTTKKLLEVLDQSNDIFMDGTFENSSRKPKVHQVYTILGKCRDMYIATAIVLMENRTTKIYNEVFEWLKNNTSSMKLNNKLIFMSDYEKATIKALKKSFPLAKVHGCFFHYSQAIVKRWTKLKLDIPDRILSMVLAIPLLPANKFYEAEEVIRNEILVYNLSARDPNIAIFMDYLHKTWIINANHVSVYDCPNLNNDGCESFNRHNKNKLGGKHPCIWTLVDGIQKALMDEEINYDRLLTNAKKPKRRTPKHVIDRRNYINTLRDEIDQEKSRFNVKTFLSMTPRSLRELQYTLKMIIGNNSDEIDWDDSVPTDVDDFVIESQNENINSINLLDEVESLIPERSCNPFLHKRLNKPQFKQLGKKSNTSIHTSDVTETIINSSVKASSLVSPYFARSVSTNPAEIITAPTQLHVHPCTITSGALDQINVISEKNEQSTYKVNGDKLIQNCSVSAIINPSVEIIASKSSNKSLQTTLKKPELEQLGKKSNKSIHTLDVNGTISNPSVKSSSLVSPYFSRSVSTNPVKIITVPTQPHVHPCTITSGALEKINVINEKNEQLKVEVDSNVNILRCSAPLTDKNPSSNASSLVAPHLNPLISTLPVTVPMQPLVLPHTINSNLFGQIISVSKNKQQLTEDENLKQILINNKWVIIKKNNDSSDLKYTPTKKKKNYINHLSNVFKRIKKKPMASDKWLKDIKKKKGKAKKRIKKS
ncbi:uncharacterized protein LOC130669508 isoform X2 [Microplitis mediator]|nr:uncharacterized protein LOC130669508 isoform X2 [Microplitis mediator]